MTHTTVQVTSDTHYSAINQWHPLQCQWPVTRYTVPVTSDKHYSASDQWHTLQRQWPVTHTTVPVTSDTHYSASNQWHALQCQWPVTPTTVQVTSDTHYSASDQWHPLQCKWPVTPTTVQVTSDTHYSASDQWHALHSIKWIRQRSYTNKNWQNKYGQVKPTGYKRNRKILSVSTEQRYQNKGFPWSTIIVWLNCLQTIEWVVPLVLFRTQVTSEKVASDSHWLVQAQLLQIAVVSCEGLVRSCTCQ